MRKKQAFLLVVLLCAASLCAPDGVPLAQDSKAASGQAPATAGPGTQNPPPAAPIKTRTRVINVDVVVTDSHGNTVRGLKKEDFQILEEHNRAQEIARFEFVDRLASATAHASQATPPAPVYTNQLSSQMTVPPTVLLMDALNTDITNQMEVHRHMVSLLKTLPANTPVAVFLLGHTLRVVQSFSTNPAVLKAAVDRALRALPSDQNPQDDPDSASNVALDQNGGTETAATLALEDFEKMEYEAQMAIRVGETADAMAQIAKYLGGYAGRKNLIWFSESFPIWIAPSSDFGSNSFNGSASYAERVRAAGEALTDAQVAVYPVDATGLAVSQISTAAQNPHINRRNPGAGFAGQMNRQNSAHLDAQATMDEIAEDTGGRVCKNRNDLSGCVQSALSDGSYYELAYYPQGTEWDGRFHKITVKTSQHGVKLSYRRGYFATNAAALPPHDAPQKLLQQACMDPLPATTIPLMAQPVAPDNKSGHPDDVRYLLTISTDALSLAPASGSRRLNLQMAICEYDPKGEKFQFFSRDLSQPVPEAVYQSWRASGIRDLFDYSAKPENQRLRFAVLDIPAGTTGALDVPAHPHEFGALPGPNFAASSAPGATTPSSSAAPSGAAPVAIPPQVLTSLTFKSNTGKSSALDWNGGKVLFSGDLDSQLGASAFFQKFVGVDFHCQSGSLVPNDATSTATPKLIFVLRSPSGPAAVVDMMGSETKYSGDLPVDPTAKTFFDQVWKLCHCQQP
jgi:VWFA-related protein